MRPMGSRASMVDTAERALMPPGVTVTFTGDTPGCSSSSPCRYSRSSYSPWKGEEAAGVCGRERVSLSTTMTQEVTRFRVHTGDTLAGDTRRGGQKKAARVDCCCAPEQ